MGLTEACPSVTICPHDRPIRCMNNECVSSVKQCEKERLISLRIQYFVKMDHVYLTRETELVSGNYLGTNLMNASIADLPACLYSICVIFLLILIFFLFQFHLNI